LLLIGEFIDLGQWHGFAADRRTAPLIISRSSALNRVAQADERASLK